MNGRTAAILVGILALLAAMVVVTAPGSGGPSAGREVALVGVPASQIGEIQATDGHRVVRIVQTPGWGGRVLTESLAERSELPGKVWPVSETTRSAGVRVLANAAMRVERSKTTEFTKGANILDLEGNVICALSMDDRALAGRVQAYVLGGERGTIDRELANFLSPESLLAWRDPALLPGLDAGVVSLSIDRKGDLLAVRRVGANWSVELPVNEPADSAKVQGLIETLIGARSQRFVDAMPTSGIVTVVVESGASGDRRRYTAMIDTNTLVADVTLDKVEGEKVTQVARAQVEVSPELVTALDVSATDFVSRRSITLPASEVAALTLGWNNRTLARTSEGWASAEDETLALAWLELLTKREADEVALSAGGARGVGSIELTGFGDLAMGRVQVRVDDEMVWVARDRVWRGYRVGEDDRKALGIE